LTAVNVHTGEFAWRVPLGITESFPPDKQNTGRPGNGGTIATAGGLVFVGATDDGRFRAFDAKSGKELWTFKLPGAAQATPMTYEGPGGKQYVVITATGGGFFGNPVTDDSVMAFALRAPQERPNRVGLLRSREANGRASGSLPDVTRLGYTPSFVFSPDDRRSSL
jgi:quinoprotein glucose dehydrogenase